MVSRETEKKLQEAGWAYNHSTSLEEMLDWLRERMANPHSPIMLLLWPAKVAVYGDGRPTRHQNLSEAVALVVLDMLARERQ